MMDYNLFKSIAFSRIKEFLPPIYSDFEPVLERVRKVNEEKDALILRPPDADSYKALPMVYLDDMYEVFCETQDLDDVLLAIASVIVNYTGYYPDDMVDLDFSKMKDRIIMNLISYDMNEELIKTIPHTDLSNMAIIYRVIMGYENNGFNSVIVNEGVLEELGLTIGELHECAMRNTKRIFPEMINKLDDGAYILTNESGLFGASMMLYKDVMSRVGEMMGDDEFYVVPSSIHELVLVSREIADPHSLVRMLAEGNDAINMSKEILSNSIYEYNCDSGECTVVASYEDA
ncbi:MAG: DUF5688 family protein [Firmicutes bacterium]|nr:DUF5688 family protein [Bacillota bacterium]